MMAARDGAIADGIARAARDFSPTLSVFALPNSTLASASRHYGMRVVAEFFADRPYVDGPPGRCPDPAGHRDGDV
jgi:UPF0271 protein